jgi:hypothetical protein
LSRSGVFGGLLNCLSPARRIKPKGIRFKPRLVNA